MAKKPISRIHHLSARIEAHLHQFAGQPNEDDVEYAAQADAYAAQADAERRQRNPYIRAGLAGGGVAGGVAIAQNKDKNKAGYQSAKAGVDSGIAAAKTAVKPYAASATEAAKTAGFRGMRGTAKVLKKGARVAEKAAMPGAAGLLTKGAKFLRKNSMKLFNAQLAA